LKHLTAHSFYDYDELNVKFIKLKILMKNLMSH